jgi:cytoskeletal protein RodZ
MKRLVTLLMFLGLVGFGLNLMAQQTPPSAQALSSQDQATPSTQQAQPPVDTQSQQSARSFEGKITKSGDKLVLQEAATQATLSARRSGSSEEVRRTEREGHGDD